MADCYFSTVLIVESLDLTALLEYPNYQDWNQFQKGVSVENLKPLWIRHWIISSNQVIGYYAHYF